MKLLTNPSTWLLCLFVLYGCSSAQKSSISKAKKLIDAAAAEKEGAFGALFGTIGQLVPYFQYVYYAWQGYQKLDGFLHPKPEYNLGQHIAMLAMQIDQISKDGKYYHDDIKRTVEELGDNMELNNKMDKFIHIVDEIESVFQDLLNKFQIEHFTYRDVEQVVRRILDKDEMAINLIKMMQKLTEARDSGSNIFQLMLHESLKDKQVCLAKKSIQQKMYSLYQTAHDTQFKGLLMLIFAYQANETSTAMEKDHEIGHALQVHLKHAINLTDLFDNYILAASRDLYTCDPEVPEEGKTYERFGRPFQKYLLNIKNVELRVRGYNTDDEVCYADCENVPKEQETLVGFEGNPLDDDGKGVYLRISTGEETTRTHMHDDVDSNRCYGGTLKNCKTIKEPEIKVCKANSSQVERYSYIEFGESTYGSESACPEPPVTIRRPEPNIIKKDVAKKACFYCMCTCDFGAKDVKYLEDLQPRDTDRYIDLTPVLADVGCVVTGVRLRKIHETHMFHLQIKQAKLLTNGRVSDAEWKNISSYYPLDREDPSDIFSPPAHREFFNYHKVAYNNTVFYLDNVVSTNDDEVVTGVSFMAHSLDDTYDKAYLGLYVQFAKFDFLSGNIREESLKWYPESPPSIKNRAHVPTEDLDLPTNYNKENKQDSNKPSYVELANSGLQYDVGQNILPFIDSQSVDTNPPLPLTGVGLYHRGVQKSGGYLGLKVTNLNLERYLPDTKMLTDQRRELLNTLNSLRKPKKKDSETKVARM